MSAASLPDAIRQIDDALARGDLARGLALAQTAVAAHPQNALAWTSLGVAQLQAREPGAEDSLRKAIALGPDQADPYAWLANLLRTTGRAEEALGLVKTAVRRWPDDATSQSLLGGILMERGEFDAAEAAFGRAERLEPHLAAHAHNRGQALTRAGRLDEAVAAYRRATACAPEGIASYIALAHVLLRQNDATASAAAFRGAYRCEPGTVRGRLQLAQALIEERAYDEAETLLAKLAQEEPRSDQPSLLLGRLMQRLGRFAEAEKDLREALRRKPTNTRLYSDLVSGRKQTKADEPFLAQAQALRDRMPPGDAGRTYLDYALGKGYDDLGRYAEAMVHFDAANEGMAAQLGSERFDPPGHAAYFDRLTATFTRDRLQTSEAEGSERPVFIVGMIRSGTTLVDQILSSHPEVASADEHPYWPVRLAGLFSGEGELPSADALKELAAGYLRLLDEFGPGCARVTNKLPTNYAVMGPIHLALPNARFIHIRRHPLDNLLSIYQTRFPNPVPYAHRRSDLVAYYRDYRRLMAHWRAVLPADRLLEVDYETLVADGEGTTRRMVDFLGLPWNDRCLRPQDNPHEIRTPSAWQARQPIFRSSVEKWRRYEPWLGELRELLEE